AAARSRPRVAAAASTSHPCHWSAISAASSASSVSAMSFQAADITRRSVPGAGVRCSDWHKAPCGASTSTTAHLSLTARRAQELPERKGNGLAKIPTDPLRIINRFGPHLSSMTGVRLSTSVEPDRLVKTHCCFCGQQCGIQLKVRDNEVIGFEPWDDFPFNRGMLCPKGV